MKKTRKPYKSRRDSTANAPFYQGPMERDPGRLAADYYAQNMLYHRGPGDHLTMDPSRQAWFPYSDPQHMGHAYGRQNPYRNPHSQHLWQQPVDYHLNAQFRDLGFPSALQSPSSFVYQPQIVPEHLLRYPNLEGMRFAEASRDGRQFSSISDPADALLMEKYRFLGPQKAYEPPHSDPSIAEPRCEQENSYAMVNEDGKKGGRYDKSQLRGDAPVFVPNAQAHETKGGKKPKDFVWLVVGKS